MLEDLSVSQLYIPIQIEDLYGMYVMLEDLYDVRCWIKEDLQICLCEMLNHQFIVFFLLIKNIKFCAATGLEPAISRLWAWRDYQFLYTARESIQPQVPLRLPCYDFAPVTKQIIVNLLVKSYFFIPIRETIVKKSITKKIRILPTHSISRAWRAVSTRLRYKFTVACWSTITSDSTFMFSNCREQSELG